VNLSSCLNLFSIEQHGLHQKPGANQVLAKGGAVSASCKYMLSGCELIDTENISLPSQNMKFGGE
jgi:hypothetical protein